MIETVAGAPVEIAADDFTPQGLRKCQQAVRDRYGAGYRWLPLDVKAEYFEWELWRYHRTPWLQIHHYTKLPAAPGTRPDWIPGSDCSTWNGALLAALSHKYAVTKDARTLDRICDLLRGMHFFFEVTGKAGLAARSVSRHDCMRPGSPQPYDAPDGTRYYYRGDPAKGTYNQIAGGFAAVMMYVQNDLPAEVRVMARKDLAAMALHVIDHDYHLTMANGQRTPHGNLTPVVASVGVPFNAQVAYQIVALGRCFPPSDPAQQARIEKAYRYLRDQHHAYWEDPWKNLLIRPQRVGASFFVKGMNDRNHVTNAAFVGMALERYQAPRESRGPFDPRFMYRLGRTMYWSMNYMERHHNALCNFMWAAMLTDPPVFDAVIKRKKNTQRGKMERMLVNGIEQLRRFKLDRFQYPGREVKTRAARWADRSRSNDYQWKEPHNVVWQVTGPATNQVTCGTDYLYAYWLFRHYRLDQHPLAVRRHGAVLKQTPAIH